jgi:hypothetical protein
MRWTSALKGGRAPPAFAAAQPAQGRGGQLRPSRCDRILDHLGSASSRVGLMQLRETPVARSARAGRRVLHPGDHRRPLPLRRHLAARGHASRLRGLVRARRQASTRCSRSWRRTSTPARRPWSFRAVDGTPLGTGRRAGCRSSSARQIIRETFFAGGSATALDTAGVQTGRDGHRVARVHAGRRRPDRALRPRPADPAPCNGRARAARVSCA